MSNLKGKEYKRFEDIKHIREDGSEYWSARELARLWNTQNGRIFIKLLSVQ